MTLLQSKMLFVILASYTVLLNRGANANELLMQTLTKILELETRVGNLETEFRNFLESLKTQLEEGFERIAMTHKNYELKVDDITKNIQSTVSKTLTEMVKSQYNAIRIAIKREKVALMSLKNEAKRHMKQIDGELQNATDEFKEEIINSTEESLKSYKSSFDSIRSDVSSLESRVSSMEQTRQVPAEYTPCLDGWMAEKDSCYYFNKVPHNFTAAKMGGNLVVIENMDENNFLKNRVRHEDPKKDWWIGLVDYVKEGVWMWADDLAPLQEFEDWAPSEPNSLYIDENCAELHWLVNFRWNDNKCSTRTNSICEMNQRNSKGIVG